VNPAHCSALLSMPLLYTVVHFNKSSQYVKWKLSNMMDAWPSHDLPRGVHWNIYFGSKSYFQSLRGLFIPALHSPEHDNTWLSPLWTLIRPVLSHASQIAWMRCLVFSGQHGEHAVSTHLQCTGRS
jgi:hypothetical protein